MLDHELLRFLASSTTHKHAQVRKACFENIHVRLIKLKKQKKAGSADVESKEMKNSFGIVGDACKIGLVDNSPGARGSARLCLIELHALAKPIFER